MTIEKATLAGGCFWCLQPVFDRLEGVLSTAVGFSGGSVENPSYEVVCYGRTGHREVLHLTFDSEKVSYEEILDAFWRSIDPTQEDGQFADRGGHYKTAIFYHSESQREAAERSKEALAQSGTFSAPIVTEILPASSFYPAEESHQQYYKKNAVHYGLYAEGSGRKPFLRRVWGDEK